MAHLHPLPTLSETPSIGAQPPLAGELGLLAQHLAQLLMASQAVQRDGTNVLPFPHAYSEDEAAALLTQAGWETSARTLRKARDEGRIGYYEFGGRVRFTQADLLSYIDGCKRCAKTEIGNIAAIGSEKSPPAKITTPIGVPPGPDVSAVAVWEQQIARKPKSGLSR